MRAPVLVVASATPYCGPCGGTGRVALTGPAGVALPISCPHCSAAPGAALPIVSLPTRQEHPRRTP